MSRKTLSNKRDEALVADYTGGITAAKDLAEKYFMQEASVKRILKSHGIDPFKELRDKQRKIVKDRILAGDDRGEAAACAGVAVATVDKWAKEMGLRCERKIAMTSVHPSSTGKIYKIISQLVHTAFPLSVISVEHNCSREYVRQVQAHCILENIPLHESRNT